MKRRDFFFLRTSNSGVLDVSCERLYMRYMNASLNGSTDELLQRILKEFLSAQTIRLHQPFWLDHQDLSKALDPILGELRSRGNHVEYV